MVPDSFDPDALLWRTSTRAKASRARRPEMRIWSITLPKFLAVYADEGHPLAPLLQRHGLPDDAASQHELEVSLQTARELPDEVALALDAPYLGLQLGRTLPPASLGLQELSLRLAPTLEEGLLRLVRLGSLQSEVESLELLVQGNEAELAHRLPGTRRALGRQGNELLLAWWVRLVRECTGRRWSPIEVCLAHAAPPDVQPLAQHFGSAKLSFAMGYNALRFPARDLALPLLSANAELLALMDERAERRVGRGDVDDVLTRIRDHISEELREGRPTLHTAAAKLGASPRTLQRRLDAQNTTFNALVEEVRLALAKEYLDNPKLALKEIAYWVGYSDLPAFIRAFKRATHLTPLEYRTRAR